MISRKAIVRVHNLETLKNACSVLDEVRRSKRADEKRVSSAPKLFPVATIFHEPWWMNITSAGSWSEAVVSSGGQVVGRLPYQISRKGFGATVLGMPPLVHVLGPALISHSPVNSAGRVMKEIAIISELLEQLPEAAHISFRLHSGITNTLAFDMAGFKNHSGYTVEIKPDTPTALWQQMRDKTRNVIRRAEENLLVDPTTAPETFLSFYRDNLGATGRTSFYAEHTCLELINECLRRGVGRILVARDQEGKMQAAVFTVWDQNTEFYLMSTRRPRSVNGAVAMLIWDALQHASSRGLTFDMDGIHVVNDGVPNLLLLTGFGGLVTPRYLVRRSCSPVQLALELRDAWSSGRSRLRSHKTD